MAARSKERNRLSSNPIVAKCKVVTAIFMLHRTAGRIKRSAFEF